MKTKHTSAHPDTRHVHTCIHPSIYTLWHHNTVHLLGWGTASVGMKQCTAFEPTTSVTDQYWWQAEPPKAFYLPSKTLTMFAITAILRYLERLTKLLVLEGTKEKGPTIHLKGHKIMCCFFLWNTWHYFRCGQVCLHTFDHIEHYIK